jgi:hypothetical protein
MNVLGCGKYKKIVAGLGNKNKQKIKGPVYGALLKNHQR